jgi:transcriptional regulator with XRE-family HTH domain
MDEIENKKVTAITQIPEPTNDTVAVRLKSARRKARLTQKAVAETIEIRLGTYKSWEYALAKPPIEIFPALAKVLSVPIWYIPFGEVETEGHSIEGIETQATALRNEGKPDRQGLDLSRREQNEINMLRWLEEKTPEYRQDISEEIIEMYIRAQREIDQ